MSARNALLASLALIVAALVYAVAVYPTLPSQIPTHWGLNGKVDGWGSKEWAAFIMIPVMVMFALLIVGFPWLSPDSFSLEPFRETFNYVMVVVVGMMGYLHFVSLYAGIRSMQNPNYDSGRLFTLGLFLALALIGNVLGKIKRNPWLGVRTPWTLANDTVWYATHRLAAKLMVAGSLLCALGAGIGVSIWICLAVLMAALLYPVFYSLWLYKKLERGGDA